VCVVSVELGRFQAKFFPTGSLNYFQMPKHRSLSAFCFRLCTLCIGFTLLWLFFSPSRCPVPMVPGYRQVSGRRKDLFCCFQPPVSVGSHGEGVGWLHHSPLSRTGLTTLMWPRSAPLLCSAMGLSLCCVVGHRTSPFTRNPFPLHFKCFIFLAPAKWWHMPNFYTPNTCAQHKGIKGEQRMNAWCLP